METEKESKENIKKAIELVKEYEKQYPGDKGANGLLAHLYYAPKKVIDILLERKDKRIKITHSNEDIDRWEWSYIE